jgi:hypothetical protein
VKNIRAKHELFLTCRRLQSLAGEVPLDLARLRHETEKLRELLDVLDPPKPCGHPAVPD